MFLTKEQILSSDDLVYEEFDVPEWGGKVRLKTMTGTERDEFEAAVFETRGKDSKINLQNFRAKLIAKTLVDEKGDRIFTDGDIELLGKKSSKALDRVFTVAQRLNGIGQREVDEMTKN